jgi:predicted unusual protein kinase regulating ubiquinone biosynthesis (AarF/ABC1/UbiB family)
MNTYFNLFHYQNEPVEADNFVEAFTNDCQTFFTGIKNIFHFFSLLEIGWICLSEYLLFQTRVFWFSCLQSKSDVDIKTSFHDSIKNVCNRLSQVNILYVKLFQALALNKELISLDMNNELLEFTDHAPYQSNEIDFKVLDSVLSKHDLLLEINEPTNAGMISLVFQAKQRDTGKKFIIKMKRKGIDGRLQRAIDSLLFFLQMVNWFSSHSWFSEWFYLTSLKKYKIDELIERNIEMIKHQTNFKEEVQNMIMIKNNCQHLKYVVIPEVIQDLTYRYDNVILMEYLEGKTIHEIEQGDRVGFAKSVLKFGFVTSFIHGITHGDLHCGNILFIKDDTDGQYPYKVGIIDFGILCELDKQFRNNLLDCITDMMERPAEETAYLILQSGIILNPGGYPLDLMTDLNDDNEGELVEMVTKIIRKILKDSKEVNQYHLYSFLKEFDLFLQKNDLMKMGLRISDQYVKVQLVLAMAHGVTMKLCEDNYIELANEVVKELFNHF